MSQKRIDDRIQKTPHHGRDHLRGAFAGTENRGVHKDAKTTRTHSTNVKSREIRRESGKEPVK